MGNLGVMFALIVLGYSLKIKKESLEDISKLVVDVGLPALIFYSFVAGFDRDMLVSMYVVLAFGMGMAFLGYGISKTIYKILSLNEEKKDQFTISATFGNTGFIGIIVCLAIFGPQGALLATVFDLGMTFVLFTFGIYVISSSNQNGVLEKLKLFINPPVIALILGFAISMLDVTIPVILLDGVELVAGMTGPLAMIFVGALLSQLKGKIEWQGKEMNLLIAIKLLFLPAVAYGFIQLFNISGIVAAVILLEAATPTMVSAPLLFQRYRGEAGFSATAVFITTLLCVITIPLIMLAFGI